MNRLIIGTLATALALTPSIAMASGEPDPDFGDGGVVDVALLDEVGPIDIDAEGRIVVVGTFDGSIAFARYLADGTPDATFSGDGRAEVDLVAARFDPVDVRVLADGSIVAAGERTTDAMDPFSNGLWAAKVSVTGQPVSGYGANGTSSELQGFVAYRGVGSVAADGSVVIVQTASGSGNTATPVDASGAFGSSFPLDVDASAFGPSCIAGGAAGQIIPVAAASTSGDFVHVAAVPFGNCPVDAAVVVTRQAIAGNAEWSTSVSSTIDSDSPHAIEIIGGDAIVAVPDGSAARLHRLSSNDGAPAGGWGTAGVATLDAGFGPVGGIAELAAGLIGVVNASPPMTPSPSVRIERLLPDGVSDPTFDRISVNVAGPLRLAAIVGAADGDIIVSTQTDDDAVLRRFVGSTPAAVPVTPARLLETRPGEDTIDGDFEGDGRLAAGSVTKIRIAGRGGVPTDATAAIVNLTMVAPSANGFGTLFPCTPTVPNASNVNYFAGNFVANSVTAKLDANGDVCLFTLAETDALIDVNGFVPAGSSLETVTPARLLETRPGEDTIDGDFEGDGRLAAGSVTKIRIAGRGGVPTDATAAIVNLTMVAPSANGFGTLFPCTPTVPNASNVNYFAGNFVANSVTAKLDANGDVCLFTLAETDALIDVNGFVPAGSSLETVTPARLLETRPGEDTIDGDFEGDGRLAAGSVTKIRIAGRGGVPTDATAAIVNLTMVAPSANGFGTLFPCTPTVPNASNVNYFAGNFVANSVTAKLDANGDVCLFTLAETDALIDVNGFISAG